MFMTLLTFLALLIIMQKTSDCIKR